jgi:radical SAM protein with 4Fe4S-binding SPASM domain
MTSLTNLPNSFCVMPWVNISTDVNGSLRPCCKFTQPNIANEYQLPNMKDGKIDVLWNDQGFQKLRQAFLDGKKPKECHQCWEEEDAGFKSMRQSFVNKVNLSNIEFSPIAKSGPIAYDLKLSNVCNLKCRICGPTASSTFFKEHKERYKERYVKIFEDKNDWMYKSEYWLENKFFNTDNEPVFIEWLNNMQHLEITGGEPMTSPENLKLLKTLDELDLSKNITFLMNTNTTMINDKVLQYIKKFKYAQILLSIDDINNRYEYQRFPGNFSIVEENLEKYKKLQQENPNVSIIIFPTISNFNIFYLDEIHQWLDNHNVRHFFNILHYSSYNCIKNLPERVKNILTNKYKNSKIDRIHELMSFMNQPGTDELHKFLTEVREVDKIRDQKFETEFNEWYKILTYE